MRPRLALLLAYLRGRGLVLVGTAAVVAAVAAVIVGFAWADPRAATVAAALAAIASTLGVLAAIYLSYQALARTDAQLEAAHRAIVLSRHPLLVPIHQPVTFPSLGGQLASHPPTEDRFTLASAPTSAYAFVSIAKDRFVIPVENIGEGPALSIRAELWCSDGRRGTASGASVVGTGRVGVLIATVGPGDTSPPGAFEAARADFPGLGISFWLELEFADVFGNMRQAAALFDPRGTGTWHYVRGADPHP